ncbi:MAG TPA: sodium-dependent transporter [Vicinamibacterales bacterium]|nr:sodium-dependent transporter [Vicinamibacterales bacterium]
MHTRETFGSRFGALMTIIGVAIGLGNVWRFPYMVGMFGGAAFVLFYVLISIVIGIPALMAEFALGRATRRGPVGAFAAGRLPCGKQVGWFFFAIVIAATGYYTAVIGWVLYYAIGQLALPFGQSIDAAAILPPDTGFSATSFLLQLACTGAITLACAIVMLKGLRGGIEKASKVIVPALSVMLIALLVRSLTLPGAMEGVRWYILKFSLADLTPAVMMGALGHMMFSLSLGGTFMVVYGSYLKAEESAAAPAIWTVIGDTGSALFAGLAIIPAVFAMGLAPTSGPGLIFTTLPQVFAAIPGGWIFGALLFLGLMGAGYLSDIGAFEVAVAGLTDNTRVSRTAAVWLVSAGVFLIAIPPSINNAIFVPWDLTFGSGMQTLGCLLAVLTVGWCMNRATALEQLSRAGGQPVPNWLIQWIRFGIPIAIISVGIWWLLTSF